MAQLGLCCLAPALVLAACYEPADRPKGPRAPEPLKPISAPDRPDKALATPGAATDGGVRLRI